MPIIYTYPSATPTSEDLLLISDVSETNPTKATRKCTVGSLVALVGSLVPGGGTVTSVELDFQTTGLTTGGFTSETITTAGTFAVGGTLVVANGGTGANTLTGVIHGNGAAAFTASDVILTAGGTQEVTGVLPEANGGTGESTYTKGDILYCDATGASLQKLAIGADTNIMVVATDRPGWTTPTSAGLVTSVDVSGGSTGLVFTGGPITTTGTVTITSGQLVVANGGTGAATLTDGGILLGSGTGMVTATAQPLNAELLIGKTATDPQLGTLTSTGGTVTISYADPNINLEAAGAAPVKINWDNQLTLRGGTSGTYIPNVARLAQYWRLGDYVYMEFYMEWNQALHGCVGTVIMENLPGSGVSPLGATVEQGSCLITVNNGWGLGDTQVAPTVGRTGVTADDEIIFRGPNYSNGGPLTDTLWTYLNGDAGPWALAGTAWWLESSV